MTAAERGVLLLCSALGERCTPLTAAQFQALGQAATALGPGEADLTRRVIPEDLVRLGCTQAETERVTALLHREAALRAYLRGAADRGFFPLTRVSEGYPAALRRKLRGDCPPVFFCAGNPALLKGPFVGLAGTRRLSPPGEAFARTAGRLAAREGLTLVTGGALGADSAALAACLKAGGSAVVFVPDDLRQRASLAGPRCLVLSEGGYDLPFTSPRALSRNQEIHALGDKTLVVQPGDHKGGTWSGAARNLRGGWSELYVFDDGSPGAAAVAAMGATPVASLTTLAGLRPARRPF